ncbi:radical SAM protein [Candidatus Poribacteria bacterium]
MKLSQFTISVPDFPKAGKYLVYNTFNQATAIIGERAKEILSNPNDPIGDDEVKYINTFKELGLVVDDSADEIAEFKDWYNTARYNKSTMRATILTTYDCNFACEYCVEEGVKKPVRMDEAQCRKTVDWLINTVEKSKSDKLLLHFYGGEPLMNVLPIDHIASEISKYAERSGISFSFNITTNGSLLKPEMVERWVPLGLTNVRVTLDGARDFHDSKRPFISGKGTFDVIIRNLLQLMDKVEIRVNTNVDSENMDSVPRLLEYLEQVGLKDKIELIKFNPIVHIQGQDNTSRPTRQTDCAPASKECEMENLLPLTWDAYRRGFRTENEIKFTICSMNLDGTAAVIDPLGRIYTCPAFVGREGFQAGDVKHEELSDKHREFMDMPVPDDCWKCAYMPMCGAGCRHFSHTKYGDMSQTHCEKEFIQKAVAESLRMNALSQQLKRERRA